MELSFDQLPAAVSRLYTKLEDIEKLLKQTQPQPDQWFDLAELCEYLPEKPSKATVYSWVHKLEIPVNKRQKKLYFLKSQIDTWLKTGRQKTVSELDAEAKNFVDNTNKEKLLTSKSHN